MKPENKFAATEIYALAFGLFLGLAFWKFGNPVILDHKIIERDSVLKNLIRKSIANTVL